MNPRMIPEMYDRHMDRLLGCEEAQDAALEAAREQGATIAERELISAAEKCGQATEGMDIEEATRIFIARFCGYIENAFPELAHMIAHGSGMGHIYPEN